MRLTEVCPSTVAMALIPLRMINITDIVLQLENYFPKLAAGVWSLPTWTVLMRKATPSLPWKTMPSAVCTPFASEASIYDIILK